MSDGPARVTQGRELRQGWKQHRLSVTRASVRARNEFPTQVSTVRGRTQTRRPGFKRSLGFPTEVQLKGPSAVGQAPVLGVEMAKLDGARMYVNTLDLCAPSRSCPFVPLPPPALIRPSKPPPLSNHMLLFTSPAQKHIQLLLVPDRLRLST